MGKVYKFVKDFKHRYRSTIVFRLKKHSAVIEKNLNPGEEVLYAFPAQKNEVTSEVFSSCVVVLTNRRIMIGQKRLLWGYFLSSITPDMFNDLTVSTGLIWATIQIDTIKELVVLTNIDKDAATEIQSKITSFMMEEKKKYAIRENNKE